MEVATARKSGRGIETLNKFDMGSRLVDVDLLGPGPPDAVAAPKMELWAGSILVDVDLLGPGPPNAVGAPKMELRAGIFGLVLENELVLW